MIKNYHTHTVRCNHATGKDEEYVMHAILQGFKVLGFSDHIKYGDDLKLNDEYIQSINILKEKYKNQIEILVAFEVEYRPEYLDYYKKLLDEKKVDYLIFGNHDYYPSNGKSRVDFINTFDDVKILDLYYEALKGALESGLFKYICHPDCFLKGYKKWDEHAIKLAHKIGKLCSKYDVYMELSGSGFRSRKYFMYNDTLVPPYPFVEFFKILKSYGLKFIIGADAHAPEQLSDSAVEFIEKMASDLKLPLVDTLDY